MYAGNMGVRLVIAPAYHARTTETTGAVEEMDMGTTENDITAVVATTREFADARALLLEKSTLGAQITKIGCDIRKRRRTSPTAVEIAKINICQNTACIPSERTSDQSVTAEVKVTYINSWIKNQQKSVSVAQNISLCNDLATKQDNQQLEQFLARVDRHVHWNALEALIDPIYLIEAWTTPRVCLTSMIRLYFLHQWCSSSDEMLIQRAYNCPAISAFTGIDPNHRALLSLAALQQFRCLLEETGLVDDVATIIIQGIKFKGHLMLVSVER